MPPRFLARTALRLLPLLIAGSVVALASCGEEEALDPNLGGATTRADASRNAFGLAAPQLTNEERRLFEIGDSFFTQNWVIAPASTDARDGLGPTFNARACSSCHVLDGRGFPPADEGESARLGLLLRLSLPGSDSVTGAPLPEPSYGGQLQDGAIGDVPPEGRVIVSHETIAGRYGDGTSYTLVAPSYAIGDPAHGPLAADVLIGPRLAPQVFGVGLLEAIDDETILALADPDDADGDGISGRVNMVWDDRVGAPAIGRFGWKANVASVEQQVAGAFLGDIGVTSSLHPAQNCPAPQVACAEAISGGEPELTDRRLAAVTFYNRTLAVPAMRSVDDDDVRAGSGLFDSFGCASCHTRSVTTGVADLDSLSEQPIQPFTDLLLHDMGEGLADGRPDFEATGAEWRTPPLWGLGLIPEVNGERFLLHDGRASTIEEAILWHGGEGEAAKEAFRLASPQERSQLIMFLEAL